MTARRCLGCGACVRLARAAEIEGLERPGIDIVVVHDWPPCPLYARLDAGEFYLKHTSKRERASA